jgi:putative ABC transport system substrate-binding protein
MRRREFIGGLGSVVAWPLVSWAQQRAMPVVALFSTEPAPIYADHLTIFRRALSDAGFSDGRHVVIEQYSADGRNDRLAAVAADLVRRQVKVIFSFGVPATSAAKAATSAIPIVFNMGVDPAALGLVASLNRPGGNVTGAVSLGGELGAKRLELLHEVMPRATLFGVLVDPANLSNESQTAEIEAASGRLGVRVHILHTRAERDFDPAFATLRGLHADGLVINNAGLFIGRYKQLAALALRNDMPSVFQYREFAAAGGLMSYGATLSGIVTIAGNYVGRILKGEKPADLPVQQSTRVETILNLKTAKALGLTIPETLLATADEVIQ